MVVGFVWGDVALVDIVGPDGVEGRHVAGHTRHEGGHQGRKSEAEQPGREVVRKHRGDHHVVVGRSVVAHGKEGAAALVVHRDGDHSGKDHERREEHLREGRDQGCPPRGVHGLCGHRALNHEEVGTPVTEGEYKTETDHHAEPADTHGIVNGASEMRPGLAPGAGFKMLAGGDRNELFLECLPSADVSESQINQRGETQHDHEELEHLVVDRRGKSPQEDVDQHDRRGDEDAGPVVPLDKSLEETGQGMEGDSRGEDRHHREGDGIEAAGLLVETQFQILGNRPRLGSVIKRHHEDRQKDHRGNCTDPVEMGRHDAVFGARGRHADHFLGPKIRGEKGKPRDPSRN